MFKSMTLGMFDWIGEFFKSMFDYIPKVMYLLYASLASLMDVLQLFFRKLAGLDVYYVDGKAVTGDIVTNFIGGIMNIQINTTDGVKIEYPILSTVFWSMIVFGLIICFVSTLVAIVKSHYTYDDKAAKGPMQYVFTAGKAVVNIVAVPVIIILALFLSQGILGALDKITSVDSGNVVSMFGTTTVVEDGKEKEVSLVTQYLKSSQTVKEATNVSSGKDVTYIYYDIFGYGGGVMYGKSNNGVANFLTSDAKQLAHIGAPSETFSGTLFRAAAYNGNRARCGYMSVEDERSNKDFTGGANNNDLKLFKNAKTDEELATMIDTAFACNFHLKEFVYYNYAYYSDPIVSMQYFTNFFGVGFDNFSKFNIACVWYYYDLWNFNFIVGFGGVSMCLSLFINIILGLMSRVFMSIVLFLVAPPLFGLAPLDGGEAQKNWRKQFISQSLMAYTSVVGMNLVLMILPLINQIKFFNITMADLIAETLFIVVGLVVIKTVIATLSQIIGAADAQKTGSDISKDVATTLGRAAFMTQGSLKVGSKVANTVGAAGLADKGAKALMSKDSMAAKIAGGVLGMASGRTEGVAVKAAGAGLGKLGNKIGNSRVGKFFSGRGKLETAERQAMGALKEDGMMKNAFVSDYIESAAKSGFDVEDWKKKAKEAGFDDDALLGSIDEAIRNNSNRKGKFSVAKVKNAFAKDNQEYGFYRAWEKAGQSVKNGEKFRAGVKNAAKESVKFTRSTARSLFNTGFTVFKKDTFFGGFKDEYLGKRKFDKEAAENTKLTAEIAKWQALNPGKPMDKDTLKDIEDRVKKG